MKRKITLLAAVLCLTMALSPAALAAEPTQAEVCYPTAVTQSEDGTELRKMYDLGPEDDPAGIPRSDFEQDGFHYTLVDVLKQELPEQESRQHTETVTLESKSKDMESVLALLPPEKEFVTEDGLSGTLSLQLETVNVEVAGYGSSTREVSATRTYPNLANQDTANIPKTIEEDGRILTLQDINWQTDNTASVGGYALGERYTAVATYTGSATSSYVKGYTVTADYTGTVSRIALNKTRYVAIFEGTPIHPIVTEEAGANSAPLDFNWAVVLIPIGLVALVGAAVGGALVLKRRREASGEEDSGLRRWDGLHRYAGGPLAAADPSGPDPLCGPRRRTAPYLRIPGDHGALAVGARDAAHYQSVVHDKGRRAADFGAGVPAVRKSALHRLRPQKVFLETQGDAPGKVLQPPPRMPGRLGKG